MAGSEERGTGAQTIIGQPNSNEASQACNEIRNKLGTPCNSPSDAANDFACR